MPAEMTDGRGAPLPAQAAANVADIVGIALEHTATRQALVVADRSSGLAVILADAYRACLPPDTTHLNFDQLDAEQVMRAFEPLRPQDLVVLIQSTSFRLEKFRIRVELFKRGLKVIEHPHLGRMRPDEYQHYVAALAYDQGYYRGVGPALRDRIGRASSATVYSGDGERLHYRSEFEAAKMNIGDYSSMKNAGGQFPIGEVFTEPRHLEAVNGRVRIFAFGDTAFRVNVPPQPITLEVRAGKVVEALGATEEFERVLASIRADEEVWVRELGFGMNRALTRERRVSDVGTYERMCGIHLSLGAKHGVYNKPALKRRDAKHHVDVFAVTEQVLLDDQVVFRDGAWQIDQA